MTVTSIWTLQCDSYIKIQINTNFAMFSKHSPSKTHPHSVTHKHSLSLSPLHMHICARMYYIIEFPEYDITMTQLPFLFNTSYTCKLYSICYHPEQGQGVTKTWTKKKLWRGLGLTSTVNWRVCSRSEPAVPSTCHRWIPGRWRTGLGGLPFGRFRRNAWLGHLSVLSAYTAASYPPTFHWNSENKFNIATLK